MTSQSSAVNCPRVAAILSLSLCLPSLLRSAEVQHLTPGDHWHEVLGDPSLPPGHHIVLAGGIYRDPRRLVIRCRGTAEQPIVIRAAVGQTPILERPDAFQNTLNLESAIHVILDGVEIRGGAAGVRIGGQPGEPIDGVSLRNCHVHDVGGAAVTCNHPKVRYQKCEFLGNHIHNTAGHGEGFYLGGNHATAIFCDGLVAGNLIHDLQGSDVSQGDGIEIKNGSHGNRIINNIIFNTKSPGITLYGSGGEAINRVENNLILDSQDNGIQVAADALIANNTIVSSRHAGIAVRKHQGAVPGRLRIQTNVVLADHGPALRVDWDRDDIAGEPILLRHNQLHATAGHPAMRLVTEAPVIAGFNRGSGPGGRGKFTITTRIDWSLPVQVHPLTWDHLDPAILQKRIWDFAARVVGHPP